MKYQGSTSSFIANDYRLMQFSVSWKPLSSGAALNVSASNTSSTSIRVAWRGGVAHEVLGYQIRYSARDTHVNASSWHNRLTCNSSNQTDLNELNTFTYYFIQVSRFNGSQISQGSNTTCRTDESGEIPVLCYLHRNEKSFIE